jgi:excisionase family DNA binding protein
VSVEPWVSLQDVAKHLQVAEDTVHRWIARKGLPAIKAGRVWRFKLTEVDAWLRTGGANKAAPPGNPDGQSS